MDKNEKIQEKFTEQVRPFLKEYYQRLLKELLRGQIIQKLNTANGNYYKRVFNEAIELSSETIVQKDIVKQLAQLKNVVRNVYINLHPSSKKHDSTIGQLVTKLEREGAIIAPWKADRSLMSLLENLSYYENDTYSLDNIDSIVEESKINLNSSIIDLLEFYGEQKVTKYFAKFNYRGTEKSVAQKADLILTTGENDLFFDFKYRKKSVVPTKDLINKIIRQVLPLGEKQYYFLVIFSEIGQFPFDKSKLQFTSTFRDALKMRNLPIETEDKIIFIPMSVNGLHLIDAELDQFKKSVIQDEIVHVFESRVAPANHPDRNDDFYEDSLEFKNKSFEIRINPLNTEFWRFGFSFAANDKMPPLNEERHVGEYADIHIVVGDLVTSAKREWTKPNRLGLVGYNYGEFESEFFGINDYSGQTVILLVKSNIDGSEVIFEIKIDDKSIGKRAIDLSKYKYCFLSAWCDYNQFRLHTEIKIFHNK